MAPPELATQFDIGEALKQLALDQRISIQGTFRTYAPTDREWRFSVGLNGEWTMW